MIACPFSPVVLGWGLLHTVHWKFFSQVPTRFIFRAENVITNSICTASTCQSVTTNIFIIYPFSNNLEKHAYIFLCKFFFFFFWLSSYLQVLLVQNIFSKILLLTCFRIFRKNDVITQFSSLLIDALTLLLYLFLRDTLIVVIMKISSGQCMIEDKIHVYKH